MIFTIQNETLNYSNVKQLYPAGIIKTGYEDETTQMSLKWLESEGLGKVEIVNYAIFINLKNGEKKAFYYGNREELDNELSSIAVQLKN